MKAARSADPARRGLAARRAALGAIAGVLERGAMLSERGGAGAPAERAEARMLADLALRRLGQIDAVLDRLVARRPKPALRHILRLMTAEILFAGRAPYGAVDAAVRLAKAGPGARGAGLVNAVGRRLAAEGSDLVAGQDAARLNTPDPLWRALEGDWGAEAAHAIAAAHLAPAPIDLTPRESEAAGVLAGRIGAQVLPTGTLRRAGRAQITALPGYEAGLWWAQDAAAALAAPLIAAEGRQVLDLCAAPGGKTLQLAASGARVTALDRSEPRLGRLSQNLARTGLSAEIVAADALEWEPGRVFDAILLDAPCSATGTLRRHPDLAHRPDLRDPTSLIELQRRLLDRAWRWLAPGGVLVYCTCSLARAEGEDQAAAFLARTPEAAILPVQSAIPGAATPEGHIRTRPDQWPELGGLDGFFIARLERRARQN